MSGKANPYDNAKMESFFRTLKVEEVYMSEYRTYEDVLNCIPYFIEEVYNSKRLHSALGYKSPIEFERMHFNSSIYSMCPTNGGQSADLVKSVSNFWGSYQNYIKT